MSSPGMNTGPALIAALGCLVALTAGTTAAQPSPGRDGCAADRTVEVSGAGEATARPDRAVVRIGVRNDADTADAALEANSRAMEQAIAAVKKAGVEAANIQTESVRLNARYGEPTRLTQSGGERQIVGYTAVNTVRVRVDELDTLGQLLDRVVSAGANTIEGISFEVRDPSALVDKAREAAWGDALHKAEQLARLAGARLGEVLAMSESSRAPRPVMAEAMMAKGMAVPIEPGTQTISADLQVRWELLSSE